MAASGAVRSGGTPNGKTRNPILKVIYTYDPAPKTITKLQRKFFHFNRNVTKVNRDAQFLQVVLEQNAKSDAVETKTFAFPLDFWYRMRYIEVAKTIKELARNIPLLLSSEGGYKMPSLKDLAKECGVSVATVSKALNGQSDIPDHPHPCSGPPDGLCPIQRPAP